MQYSGGTRISKTEASKPKCVGAKLLMGQMFPKNSMNIREIQPRGREGDVRP